MCCCLLEGEDGWMGSVCMYVVDDMEKERIEKEFVSSYVKVGYR
jgi:hypothetical protein